MQFLDIFKNSQFSDSVSISSTISTTQSQGQKFHIDSYDLIIKVPLAISDFLVDKAGNRLFDISRHVSTYLTKLMGLLMPDDFLASFQSEGRNSMFAPSIKDEDQLSVRLDLSESQGKPA
jgi:hypothetical protein